MTIMEKFLIGPIVVNTPDELFELFEQRGRTNMNYFVIYNGIKWKWTKVFASRVKLFRKFYIENSKLLGDQAVFIELHNKHTASLLGIKDEGVVHHFVHKIENYDVPGNPVKFFNINLI